MQKLIYYRSFSVPRLTSTRCTEEVRRRLNPGSGIQDDVVDSRAQVKSRILEELFERAEVVVTLDLQPTEPHQWGPERGYAGAGERAAVAGLADAPHRAGRREAGGGQERLRSAAMTRSARARHV